MPKKTRTYKVTTALNSKDSPSTGMVTAYSGRSPWPKEIKHYMYLEIQDCHSKIRLHNSQIDTMSDFIKKMRRLRDALNDYIEHLES